MLQTTTCLYLFPPTEQVSPCSSWRQTSAPGVRQVRTKETKMWGKWEWEESSPWPFYSRCWPCSRTPRGPWPWPGWGRRWGCRRCRPRARDSARSWPQSPSPSCTRTGRTTTCTGKVTIWRISRGSHLFFSLARSPFSVRFRTAMFMISLRPEPLAVAMPYPLASRFLPTFRINVINIGHIWAKCSKNTWDKQIYLYIFYFNILLPRLGPVRVFLITNKKECAR